MFRTCLTWGIIAGCPEHLLYYLKKVRKDNNITQEQLSSFLNTTQSTISAYESGKTDLLTAFAIQIVVKYNISLEWLCGRKNTND